jgi:hypothetical protein
MNTTWKILGIKADGDLITEARYFARLENQFAAVETEGNWFFREPKMSVAFDQVTETMIVGWIKAETMADGKNMIEARLAEQMVNVVEQQARPLPWAPQVFTPNFEE